MVVVPAGVAVAAAVAMAVPVVQDDSAVFVTVVPCTAALPCCLKFGKSRGTCVSPKAAREFGKPMYLKQKPGHRSHNTCTLQKIHQDDSIPRRTDRSWNLSPRDLGPATVGCRLDWRSGLSF